MAMNVLTVNRLLWHRLCRLAVTRFKLEAQTGFRAEEQGN